MNPVGRSGGIISIWDPHVFVRSHTFSSRHFLAVSGHWLGFPGTTTLVNVYGPQSIQEKRKLWADLLDLKRSIDGTWVFLGDFNAVRYEQERLNSRFCRILLLTSTISLQMLAYMNSVWGVGNSLTSVMMGENSVNSIDCSNFIYHQPLTTIIALPREYSDHTPLVLKPSNQDFGPPPFRFFNSWIHREDFDATFSNAWNSFIGFGTPDTFLMAKLRFVRNEFSKWRNTETAKESKLLSQLKKRVVDIEVLAETRTLSVGELTKRRDCKGKIQELEYFARIDIQQKAKIRWISDGDENSRFFHNAIKIKGRKNRLHGLVIDGRWNTYLSDIKREVHRFFGNKFEDKWPIRPKLISDEFKTLSSDQRRFLDEPITNVEIKQAVWSCGGDKSPGPDGYTFKVLKNKWEIVKYDIIHFVSYFETFGRLAKGCNSSFITLIPKIKDPLNLGDYRPISLIGCMNKIVAKILALRLKTVIGSVIDDVQSAYIEGRHILEGPLILNEVCSWAKKSKGKGVPTKNRF